MQLDTSLNAVESIGYNPEHFLNPDGGTANQRPDPVKRGDQAKS